MSPVLERISIKIHYLLHKFFIWSMTVNTAVKIFINIISLILYESIPVFLCPVIITKLCFIFVKLIIKGICISVAFLRAENSWMPLSLIQYESKAWIAGIFFVINIFRNCRNPRCFWLLLYLIDLFCSIDMLFYL